MEKEIPDEIFMVPYKNCLKDEPIIAAIMQANYLGLKRKQITKVVTSSHFGDGLRLRFEFKQPIPGITDGSR